MKDLKDYIRRYYSMSTSEIEFMCRQIGLQQYIGYSRNALIEKLARRDYYFQK